MRLNAYLARAGIASRRGSDDLIKEGRVKVNDQPGQLNTYVHAGDRVEVDGEPVAAQRLTYVLLNKPAGTVTSPLTSTNADSSTPICASFTWKSA